MKIYAVYNIKGGVGKTASAVNLAYLSARQGARTLLWDLDPQGAASFYFRIRPRIKGGAKKLVRGKVDLDAQVKGTDYENLDLLPADFSYRNMDVSLSEAKKPTLQLLKLLRPISREYDRLFIDCPPSISLVSENVFMAADRLLVPMLPTVLSVRTYEQLQDFLKARKMKGLKLSTFFTMVDSRKAMHQSIMRELPQRYKGFMQSAIPYNSLVEQMGIKREPLHAYAPNSVAARAYQELWQEIEG